MRVLSASACSRAQDFVALLAGPLLGLGGSRVGLLTRLERGFLAKALCVALGLMDEPLGLCERAVQRLGGDPAPAGGPPDNCADRDEEEKEAEEENERDKRTGR